MAEKLFAERGFDGVTLRGIAAEMGVSHTLPYRYFTDKAQIFGAVRMEAWGRYVDALAAAAAERGDPESRMRAIAYAAFRFAREQPHAYRVNFEMTREFDAVAPGFVSREGEGASVLFDAVSDAIDFGLVAGDPATVAHLFWAPLHGLISLDLAGKLRLGRSIDDLIEPLLDMVWRGLAPGPNATGPGP